MRTKIFGVLLSTCLLLWSFLCVSAEDVTQVDYKLQPQQVLEAYLNAYKDFDAESVLKYSISERHKDTKDYRDSVIASFNNTTDSNTTASYEIKSQTVEDQDTVQYIVTILFKDGLLVEGPEVVKKIDGEWKVYLYRDVRKCKFDIIDVPEQDRELFESYEERVKNEQQKIQQAIQSQKSQGGYIISPMAYSQTQFASWNFRPLAGGAYDFTPGVGPIISGTVDEFRINFRQWANTSSPILVEYSIWDNIGPVISPKGNLPVSINNSGVSYNFSIPTYTSSFTEALLFLENMTSIGTNTYGEGYAIRY